MVIFLEKFLKKIKKYFLFQSLIIRKFFLSLDTPFILVPRGEFSAEALNIKFWKKKLLF